VTQPPISTRSQNDINDKVEKQQANHSKSFSTGEEGKLSTTAIMQLKEAYGGGINTNDFIYPPPPDLLPIEDAFEVKLVENTRVTPDSHWQDVRQLTFIMDDDITYDPGDTMTIYPKNFPEDVQALIDLMDWNADADKPLTFSPTHPDFYLAKNFMVSVPNLNPLPKTTLRQLLAHNLDITAIPKRSFFEIIAHYTSDPIHKERLLEFTNPTFTDEFYDYTTRPRRSILEVRHDFPSVKLPWKWAPSLFPVIRGRKFSISSAGVIKQWNGKERMMRLQLLVAIVRYRTVLKKVRQGLCSRYLASLPPGTILNVTFGNSSFGSFSKTNPQLPIIMIAPGTGVAPMRSLIWERAALAMENPEAVGEAVLFFGSRNKNADYFYRKEWEQERSLKVQVFTAFSRDQKEKVYVQDNIREQGVLVRRLLKAGAVVYVCGSSGKMPLAVREALLDVMAVGAERGRESAEEGLAFMERMGRYIQESW
jgi:sulfite reductase alpha subunit-like flavoprotein